ncbi:MAG: hypothetical protein AB7S99_12910 [Pseudodonghicola sp.]
MNLNQIVNMILRLLMRRVINTGVNAGINAASNLTRKQRPGRPAGPDRYGVPLHTMHDGVEEEPIDAVAVEHGQEQAQAQAQAKMTPEQRERQRQIRQARRAARSGSAPR